MILVSDQFCLILNMTRTGPHLVVFMCIQSQHYGHMEASLNNNLSATSAQLLGEVLLDGNL